MKPSVVKARILQLQMENAAIKQKMAAASIKSNQAKPFYVTFETAINGLTIKFK